MYLGFFLQDARVFDRIQGAGGPDQRDVPLAERLVINLGDDMLFAQGLVQVLTNSTVSTIRTHKNVTAGRAVVIKSHGDPVLVLFKGEDLLGHAEVLWRDLFEQQGTEVRTREQDTVIANTV
jgi:hypothetical protein